MSLIFAEKADTIRAMVFELCKEIVPEHKAQLINCLKAMNLKLGLPINFGSHPASTDRAPCPLTCRAFRSYKQETSNDGKIKNAQP